MLVCELRKCSLRKNLLEVRRQFSEGIMTACQLVPSRPLVDFMFIQLT